MRLLCKISTLVDNDVSDDDNNNSNSNSTSYSNSNSNNNNNNNNAPALTPIMLLEEARAEIQRLQQQLKTPATPVRG